MRKFKKLSSFIIAMLFVMMFPITASANSSWIWVSETRPLDLLPIVVAITLAIEICAVNCFAKVKELKRVIPVVTLANLFSFLVPYVFEAISPNNAYSCLVSEEGVFCVINHTVEHCPFYTISVFFLVLTLLLEVPIVYSFCKKKVESKKRLFYVIVIANTLTTVITFAVERIFCYGEW